jgi:hypothetical protein
MNSIELVLPRGAACLRQPVALPGSPWSARLLAISVAVCVRLATVERRLRLQRAVNRLQERAAGYAASQPSFASDLQAACDRREP